MMVLVYVQCLSQGIDELENDIWEEIVVVEVT
jgi:hypothetical protein